MLFAGDREVTWENFRCAEYVSDYIPLREQSPELLNRAGKGAAGMVDPIADMLTRIRNAIMARHESVDIPYSNIKFAISKILKEEGYIRNYKTFVDETRKKFLKVYISYDENSKSVITGLQRVSKPGRRVYVGADAISKLKTQAERGCRFHIERTYD